MKATIYKITAVFGFIIFSLNQSSGQKFTFGLLGGAHGYKVSFEDKDDRDEFDSKLKFGYRLGAYIAFPLENKFSWSTELYYSKKGRKLEQLPEGFINDANYTFIETSVLLRKAYTLKLIPGLEGNWFFNVGPNINYWLNGTGTIDAAVDLDYTVKFEEGAGDLENNYIVDGKRWLFGLEIGAGVEAPVAKNQNVQIELRFTLGQTFLGTKDGSIPVNDFQVDDNLRSYYRVLSLILRYGIDLDIMSSRKGKSTNKRSNRRR